jgi:hypothetical protein
MKVSAKPLNTLLATMLVTGCAVATSASPAGAATLSATRATASLTSSAPAPSSVPPPKKSRDGTHYTRCNDGNCDVAVAGTRRITFLGHSVLVKVRARRSISLAASFSPGSTVGSTLSGDCGATAYFALAGASVLSTSCSGRPTPAPGYIAFQLRGWTKGGAAVLQMVKG